MFQINTMSMHKDNLLNERKLTEFVKLQKTETDSYNSWSINIANTDTSTYDLSVKNLQRKDKTVLRRPEEIIE